MCDSCECTGFEPHLWKAGKCRACNHPLDSHHSSTIVVPPTEEQTTESIGKLSVERLEPFSKLEMVPPSPRVSSSSRLSRGLSRSYSSSSPIVKTPDSVASSPVVVTRDIQERKDERRLSRTSVPSPVVIANGPQEMRKTEGTTTISRLSSSSRISAGSPVVVTANGPQQVKRTEGSTISRLSSSSRVSVPSPPPVVPVVVANGPQEVKKTATRLSSASRIYVAPPGVPANGPQEVKKTEEEQATATTTTTRPLPRIYVASPQVVANGPQVMEEGTTTSRLSAARISVISSVVANGPQVMKKTEDRVVRTKLYSSSTITAASPVAMETKESVQERRLSARLSSSSAPVVRTSTDEGRRRLIIAEILTTERDYCRDLVFMAQVDISFRFSLSPSPLSPLSFFSLFSLFSLSLSLSSHLLRLAGDYHAHGGYS
jgi:hypothetical protein